MFLAEPRNFLRQLLNPQKINFLAFSRQKCYARSRAGTNIITHQRRLLATGHENLRNIVKISCERLSYSICMTSEPSKCGCGCHNPTDVCGRGYPQQRWNRVTRSLWVIFATGSPGHAKSWHWPGLRWTSTRTANRF